MLVGAPACLSIVCRATGTTPCPRPCVQSSVRSPRLCFVLGGRVGDVAATREGESVCLGGAGMASRLESHGHSRGLRITCILMRQRRASKSRAEFRTNFVARPPPPPGPGCRAGRAARGRGDRKPEPHTQPHTVGISRPDDRDAVDPDRRPARRMRTHTRQQNQLPILPAKQTIDNVPPDP